MIQPLDELITSVLQLPEAARAELAGKLIASLDASPTDEDVTATWETEIDRRREEIERGDVPLVGWQEMQEKLRARLSDG